MRCAGGFCATARGLPRAAGATARHTPLCCRTQAAAPPPPTTRRRRGSGRHKWRWAAELKDRSTACSSGCRQQHRERRPTWPPHTPYRARTSADCKARRPPPSGPRWDHTRTLRTRACRPDRAHSWRPADHTMGGRRTMRNLRPTGTCLGLHNAAAARHPNKRKCRPLRACAGRPPNTSRSRRNRRYRIHPTPRPHTTPRPRPGFRPVECSALHSTPGRRRWPTAYIFLRADNLAR